MEYFSPKVVENNNNPTKKIFDPQKNFRYLCKTIRDRIINVPNACKLVGKGSNGQMIKFVWRNSDEVDVKYVEINDSLEITLFDNNTQVIITMKEWISLKDLEYFLKKHNEGVVAKFTE